jgi:hypothetical protein
MKDGLDKTDAEFSQYYYYRRPRYYAARDTMPGRVITGRATMPAAVLSRRYRRW